MLTLPDGTIHSEISIPNGALAPELAPVLPLLQQLTQLRAARYQPADGAPHASVNHDPFRVVLVLAQDMRTDDGIAAVLREAPVISIPRVGLGRAYGFVPRPTPNP